MRRPFGQWNCKHTIFPIIMGVSVQALDEETISRYNEMSTQPITIDGKTKTRYEWSQVQRKIETAVREQKDIVTVAKASGDRKAERKVRSSVSTLMDYYDKVSSASKIQPEYGRMAAGNTLIGLQSTSGYGIINSESGAVYHRVLDASGNEKYHYLQTDAIQKLDSPQAIAKYFSYKDEWGEVQEPIDVSFSEMKLETQKEAAEGIEWARTAFGLKKLPLEIQTAKLSAATVGEYREGSRTLSFRKSIKSDEAFATAVHEMTHFADQITGPKAKEIVDQARKNLGLKANANKYFNQRFEIVGGAKNIKDVDDPHELLAYSIERFATNRSNALADEIAKVAMERMRFE